MRGEEFITIDSTYAFKGQVRLVIPTNAKAGVYRIDLGRTTYEKVMDEGEHFIDFIYNKEDISLSSDFNAPWDSLTVIRSAENRIWHFFQREKIKHLRELAAKEKQLDRLWREKKKRESMKVANEFNEMQLTFDNYLFETSRRYSNTLVSRLIVMQRQPLRDGFLTPKERLRDQKKYFFRYINFGDRQQVYSPTFTDKLFDYLVLFNTSSLSPQQRTQAYCQAIDNILNQTQNNPEVAAFIKSYLKHGFSLLQMNDVLAFIDQH